MEYRYKVTTLTVGGKKETYTLELQTYNLYEATTRARDIFESYPYTKLVIEVVQRK